MIPKGMKVIYFSRLARSDQEDGFLHKELDDWYYYLCPEVLAHTGELSR